MIKVVKKRIQQKLIETLHEILDLLDETELDIELQKIIIEGVYYDLCGGDEKKFEALANFRHILKEHPLIKNKPIVN